jgi:hypothetical protein
MNPVNKKLTEPETQNNAMPQRVPASGKPSKAMQLAARKMIGLDQSRTETKKNLPKPSAGAPPIQELSYKA